MRSNFLMACCALLAPFFFGCSLLVGDYSTADGGHNDGDAKDGAVVCSSSSTVDVPVMYDTFIDWNMPDVSHENSYLIVGLSGDTTGTDFGRERVYLMFNSNEIRDKLSGCNLKKATLKLHLFWLSCGTDSCNNGARFLAYPMPNTWIADCNYFDCIACFDDLSNSINSVEWDLGFGKGNFDIDEWIDLDVTSLVAIWLEGNDSKMAIKVCLENKVDQNMTVNIYSLENNGGDSANAPHLSLEFCSD